MERRIVSSGKSSDRASGGRSVAKGSMGSVSVFGSDMVGSLGRKVTLDKVWVLSLAAGRVSEGRVTLT